MPTPTRAELLAAAQAFCDSCAQKKPLDEILSHFSPPPPPPSSSSKGEAKGETNEIIVHEHGLPQLAPFLGREFRGVQGARRYFEILGECLGYEGMRFVEFIVDCGDDGDEKNGGGGAKGGGGRGGKVVVRGLARFTWLETGQAWDETFVYVLGFDGGAGLVRYEVWADSGAAYLARRGELGGGGKGGE